MNETTIQFSNLPALGADLQGGTFAGLTTRKDGTHCAVILLPNKAQELEWQRAMDWANELNAEVPSRPVAALLFANAKDKLSDDWHWTCEEYGASYAWYCNFTYGSHTRAHKDTQCAAVAVRLIPITA